MINMKKSQKILKNLDLTGNYIYNAQTDLPTNHFDIKSNQIINKQFVDKRTLFETQNSQNKSTYFPWLNNIHQLPIVDILDKLLYPIINPTYTNPKINYYKFNNYGNATNISNATLNGGLIVDIENTDREELVNEVVKLAFVDTHDDSLFEFEANQNGEILFNINWSNDIKKIIIYKNFGPATLKYNSVGEAYTDTNFSNVYKLKEEVSLEYFKSIFNLIDKFYIINSIEDTKVNLYEQYLDYVNLTGSDLESKNTSFIKIQPNKYVESLFLIDEKLINKQIDFRIFDITNFKTTDIVTYLVQDILLRNESGLNITTVIDNKVYYVGYMDFGYFENKSHNISINFK